MENTKKSNESQDGNTIQHSGPDAAPPSSTPAETPFSKDDVLKIAILYLQSLARETLSRDKLLLAGYATLAEASKLGFSEKKVKAIMKWLYENLEHNRKSNPISGLF